ncbi:Heat shock protein HslJ [Soonwooa buanensis]|uniref:Heat shock protein HslJ n=1 Tax=Soonwooa buanensis TaxID=619805 RepID=A0A1T5CPV4_9FLAO|nr:copper resistance protein NlpE N-terminal domain-containing protein [Soonwooa buanensis]SKB61447.1 Heat shock protein HslJ [Soonwooa buanensis]
MINKNTIKNLGFSAFAIAMLSLSSCSTTPKSSLPDGHTAKTSLDYPGVYLGVLPCADCSGIKTRIYLNKDNTYILQQDYLGKNGTSILENGTYSFDESGNVVNLKPKTKNGQSLKLFVGEDNISMLNQDGTKITTSLKDHYVLTKDYNELLNKKWYLKEMYGKAFDAQKTSKKEGYLSLDEKTSRYSSNAGCNQMNGAFTIEPGNKINFNQGMSTMMACQDMEAETTFGKVLKETKYFDVQLDKLLLLNSKHETIATFKVPVSKL